MSTTDDQVAGRITPVASPAGSPFHSLDGEPVRPGGDAYPQLVDALRRVQDSVAGSHPPEDVAREAARLLDRVHAHLAPHQVGDDARIFGRRWDEMGRGQTLTPPSRVLNADDSHLTVRLQLTPFHAGRGGAHGGVVPLLFDDVLGGLANVKGPARTAYLHVDFRRVTPISEELDLSARVISVEGRKQVLRATLHDAQGRLLAEAEGLFVTPRSSSAGGRT